MTDGNGNGNEGKDKAKVEYAAIQKRMKELRIAQQKLFDDFPDLASDSGDDFGTEIENEKKEEPKKMKKSESNLFQDVDLMSMIKSETKKIDLSWIVPCKNLKNFGADKLSGRFSK